MPHTAPAIAQLLSPITHRLIDLSHDTGEHAHSITQQNTIGRVVDIGLYHRSSYIMLMISRRSPSTTDGIRSSVCPYLFESDEKTATANASTASQMEKYIPFRVGC